MLRLGGCAGLIVGCALSFAVARLVWTENGRAVLMVVLVETDFHDQALWVADGLVRDYPRSSWQYYRVQGMLRRWQGRTDESFAAYDAAIAAFPDLWWPYSHRCFYTAILGSDRQVAEVLATCDRSIALGPSDPGLAHDRRAFARARAGDRAGAIEDWDLTLEYLGPRPERARGEDVRAIRRAWLATLEAGGDPLTPEVLAAERERYGARGR